MEFVIGSLNQAKIKAARKGIHTYYPQAIIHETNAASEVPAQPVGDEETLQGAIHRARNAQSLVIGSIGIGLEGGVRLLNEGMYLCNWGALYLPGGEIITAGGAQIKLPNELARQILAGEELGVVIDSYANKKGIRQKEGAIGIFTNGSLSRIDLFTYMIHLLIGQYKYKTNNRKPC